MGSTQVSHTQVTRCDKKEKVGKLPECGHVVRCSTKPCPLRRHSFSAPNSSHVNSQQRRGGEGKLHFLASLERESM